VKIALGAMSIGDILDQGLKILLARLSTFYLINLVVLSPILVIAFAMPPQNALAFSLENLIEKLLLVILQPIATAATLYVISRDYLGQSAGAGDALQFAVGRFGRLLWASFLAGIVIMVGGLLCIPAFIFTVWYIFVGQVVVMENLGGEKALGRSKDLTSGHRWRIFGIYILLLVIALVISLAVGALDLVLPQFEIVITDAGRTQILNYLNYGIQQVLLWIVQVLIESYSAICFTLFYFDLRNRKEGFDLQLAALPEAQPA
jgi:hypothetical protein